LFLQHHLGQGVAAHGVGILGGAGEDLGPAVSNGSRQSDVWVLEQFTRWQEVNWDYAGQLQKAQMDVAQVDAERDFRLSPESRRGLGA
jgi:hypothetical protein